MSKNISLVKGKVIVEGKFSGAEQEILIEKYKSKTVFEFWRTQLKSLSFLKDLPHLEGLSLINARVEDLSALSEIGTLKRLVLNELKLGGSWVFLADLAQIEELHLLNTRGELALPDLKRLEHLKAFRTFACKGLTDISILKDAPNLEEVELIDTGLTPEKLLPLFEKPSVKYLSCTFSLKKNNEIFQELLVKYGKEAYKEPA